MSFQKAQGGSVVRAEEVLAKVTTKAIQSHRPVAPPLPHQVGSDEKAAVKAMARVRGSRHRVTHYGRAVPFAKSKTP